MRKNPLAEAAVEAIELRKFDEDRTFDLPDLPVKKKKKNKSKPVQRSLGLLRDNGWTVTIVEKYMKHPGMPFGKRIDVFGFGDLLAIRRRMKGRDGKTIHPAAIALVQCCADGDFAKHKDKILAIPEFYEWKACGGTVFLQGWSLKGPRGQKKDWTMREEEL